jgi:DNA processing protein
MACDRTFALARDVAAAGAAVLSGGALGIDAAAHEGALAAGGRTWAVLGCGPDVVYPDRHASLFARIARQGGLLSEYPPGTLPLAWHFPARNRIIAGLSDVVVLLEAGAKSGSLYTARAAARLGRPVLVVPGSAGADHLLADGLARPLADLTDLLGPCAGAAQRPVPVRIAALLGALEKASDPAYLAKVLARPVGEVLALLVEAELEGFICRRPGGRFEVLRVH